MTVHIPDFSTANVLVFGDVMLDRYWHGHTGRISPEAPVPVVHINDIEERPGGAGNVALNIRALGASTTLFALCGKDQAAQTLEKQLRDAKVGRALLKSDNIPTVTKLRVLSVHQQLIRLDFEDAKQTPPLDNLIKDCCEKLPQAGALILSDYGKGTLANPQQLIQAAKAAHVPVLVDPKHNDFEIYRGATLVTPNFKEFEAVVGSCETEEELIEKGMNLLQAHDIESILVTRGEKGMTLLSKGHEPYYQATQAQEVFDVTGAGDTVIAVLAAAIAAGEELPNAVSLANLAAGIVVGKLGAATVSEDELDQAVHGAPPAKHHGVLSEDQLEKLVKEAQAEGKKVVMTNGCFDIIHPGHVAYLEEAKELGDYLIVAVNDDASISRLKGPKRPINPLENRMAVLAGLRSVDWVVPFSEDTPHRLVSRMKPDVLVKGGDWQISDIVGSDVVLKNGGSVKSLQFIDGVSTTDIIETICAKENNKENHK